MDNFDRWLAENKGKNVFDLPCDEMPCYTMCKEHKRNSQDCYGTFGKWGHSLSGEER